MFAYIRRENLLDVFCLVQASF